MPLKQEKKSDALENRDHYSGHKTTGHDWNGITELNTRVPRLLLVCLALAFLFSLVYWYLLPAWPLGNDYTRGKLATDQKQEIAKQQELAAEDRSQWSTAIVTDTFDEIADNSDLMKIVMNRGAVLFGDNCAMCHGYNLEGGLHFPKLNDGSWLWGGRPEQIQKTLTVGINTGMDGTRVAQMPAFGETKIIDAGSINDVVTYIQSLSNSQIGNGARVEESLSVTRGEKVFGKFCASCHGQNAEGNTIFGAPNLTDNYWLYGDDKDALVHSVYYGRAGVMPAWKDRLSELDIKVLSMYVAQMAASQLQGAKNATNE